MIKKLLFKIQYKIAWRLLWLGVKIRPDYWECDSCSNIERFEREIICWKCGKGEMIYIGE